MCSDESLVGLTRPFGLFGRLEGRGREGLWAEGIRGKDMEIFHPFYENEFVENDK